MCIAFIGSVFAQTYPTSSWLDNADTSWYDETQSSFDIATAEALAGLSELVEGNITFADKTINIVADIDLDGHLWSPIARKNTTPFKGTVNGNNKTISNLWITGLNRDYLGLFGWGEGATFKDINLDTVNIDDSGDASGALVGNLYNSGLIENCHVSNANVKVIGANIGGLIGGLTVGSTVKKSSFKGNVEGEHQVGGFIGSPWNNSHVLECFSEGTVTAGYQVGGLVGFVTFAFPPGPDCTVIDSYSRSNVVSNDPYGAAGGLLGEIQTNFMVKNSYSTGTVIATNAAGGFVGLVGNMISENNYFDTESSNMTDGVGDINGPPNDFNIVGKSTSEMKSVDLVNLLNDGNTDGPWGIDSSRNDGYPILEQILSVGDFGINDLSLKIYPTIVDQNFTISAEENLTAYQIYNVNGGLVSEGKLNSNLAEVNVGSLGSGIYFVQIQSENNVITKKIIKK